MSTHGRDNSVNTHISDLGVRTLNIVGIHDALLRTAQLLIHTRLLLGAPHTAVLWVRVLTEAAVLPPHGAVVQSDYEKKKLIRCLIVDTTHNCNWCSCINSSCYPKDAFENKTYAIVAL